MLKKTKKEDLRIKKTKKALFSALPVLLSRQKFTKITVHDICTESMVSRTAFYAHFKDKYDFLGQWLAEQKKNLLLSLENKTEQQVEDALTEILQEKSNLIVNLLENADQEQQHLFFRFLAPDLYYTQSENNTVLADFLAGGIYQVMLGHMAGHRRVSNDETRKTIGFLYRMIAAIVTWNTKPTGRER
jgi:AcrR family transcriptional regulator